MVLGTNARPVNIEHPQVFKLKVIKGVFSFLLAVRSYAAKGEIPPN